MPDRPVPRSVLDAFGAEGPSLPLPGGQGESQRAGDLVFKPVRDADETVGIAEALEDVEERGFRLGRPVRALDGRWIVDGWAAARYVEGAAEPGGHWAELLAAGRAFAAALTARRRPEFLDRRTHRWVFADAVAWGETDGEGLQPVAPLLARLVALRRPVDAPNQLVHGDLAGNVLFEAGLPPAVIDVSPYWRPLEYADAIVAVDGLAWHGAGPELLRLAASSSLFPQMFVRALVFRLVAEDLGSRAEGVSPDRDLARFAALTDTAEELATGDRFT